MSVIEPTRPPWNFEPWTEGQRPAESAVLTDHRFLTADEIRKLLDV